MSPPDLIRKLHGYIYEAITEETYGNDAVLSTCLELALLEIDHKRCCFPDPLNEPLFWRRYFIPWVKDAVAEIRETSQAFHDAVLKAAGKGG